jgi:hypothetical protein
MTRRVDFNEWQHMRATIAATQTRILVGTEAPATERLSELPAGRPAEGRPLHSHRPRSDEEWKAIEDGVRALLAARRSSGRWRHTTRRQIAIG